MKLIILYAPLICSGVPRGGENGAPARASKAGGHLKSEITKIKMLQLGDFSYCRATTTQSCKWASFWSPNPARARNNKPESGRSLTFIFEAQFIPKGKFAEWVKICATAGYQKTQCAGVAAGTRFYHTQNINLLDQNMNLNKHKLSLLVNANTAECNVFWHKNKLSRNYPQWRYRHKRNYLG